MTAIFSWLWPKGMKLAAIALVFSLSGGLSLGDPALAPSTDSIDAPYLVAAAYPSWRAGAFPPETIPFESIDRLGHVFIMPDADGGLSIPPGFLMPELLTEAHAHGAQVSLAVGGAESHPAFDAMTSNPASRAAFVQNLTDLVVEQGYDGVHIDWEFPQTPEDRQNLNALMAALRTSLDATGQAVYLEIAVSAGEFFGEWIDADTLTPLVAHYIVMAYSYHGEWSSRSGHNAPLYPGAYSEDPGACVDGSVDYWVETRGVPTSKILLGLPFFGNWFGSEDLGQPFSRFRQADYSDIKPLIGQGYTYRWDYDSVVPYLTQDVGAGVWSYDDPSSIRAKSRYAQVRGLGGVAIWDMTMDVVNGEHELLDATQIPRTLYEFYLPVLLRSPES